MVNYGTLFVLVALVGISAALPRNARVNRQSDTDVNVVDENALPEAVEAETPVTIASRQALNDDVDTVNALDEDTSLGLPSNYSSIRSNVVKTFSCEGRNYGYYADVENECQIFHVCMPVVLPGSRSQTFKWSFICPEQTIFNQESFTCTRPEDSAACDEAPQYYRLNDNFGVTSKPDPGFQSRSGNSADVPVEEVASRAAVDGNQEAPAEEVAPAEEATTPTSSVEETSS